MKPHLERTLLTESVKTDISDLGIQIRGLGLTEIVHCVRPQVLGESNSDLFACRENLHLEHLIHLDFALEEAHRVLKSGGELLASVPTEGGLAWVLGRRLTTARRHTSDDLDYLRANAIDHCNTVWQIEKAISRHFRVARRLVFPTGIPSYHSNLIVTWSVRK